jgi:hypothetical protein
MGTQAHELGVRFGFSRKKRNGLLVFQIRNDLET